MPQVRWPDFSGINNLAVTGQITGTGGLAVSQTASSPGSVVTLSNSTNNYSGATAINSGTLQISGSGSLGGGTYGGAISVGSGMTFKYSSSAALTFSGIISGAGTLTKDTGSSSTLTLSGANTYTGPTTINAGTLTLSGSWNKGSNTATISVAAAATLNGAGVVTAATLSDSGGGTVNLTGNNQVGAVSTTGTIGGFNFNDAQSVSLGSINSSGAILVTTGSGADITLASGTVLTSSVTDSAVTLAAGRNFINNAGSGAISLTGSGSPNWLIYSTTPGADTFGSLNSGNTAVWNATYGGTITQTGNRYVFSYQPTVTLTTTSDSKTYGVNHASAVANDYSVSGLSTGVVNAFAADSNATAFSGTPTVTSTGSAASATVAGGPYLISIAQNLSGVDGYAVAYSSAGQLTVNPAPLTVTANNQGMTYGASMPSLTASYSGFVNGDTSASLTTAPTVVSGTLATANAGTYTGTLTASGAVDGNYTIGYVPGTLTINKAPLTVTANNQGMTYGGSMPSLTASYSGFVNGDSSANLTAQPTVVSGTLASANAGTYTGTLTASGAVDGNYSISYMPGTLTINKAALTVTANNQGMTYGGTMPSLTASYAGFVNGDSSASLTTAPSVVSGTLASANAGTYTGTLTASGAVDGNYTIGYVPGTLTINKAPLTITANNQGMTYGGTMPSLTASYAGFVNGDSAASLTTAPTVVSATPANANAATYAGTLTASGAVDSNYTICYAPGTLTINKAPLTVTANNQGMTYGGSMPSLTASYAGFVNGDSAASLTTAPSVVSGTLAKANAGTYTGTITATAPWTATTPSATCPAR